MQSIINQALLELLKLYVAKQVEFSITLDNHNNWDIVLPSRLSGLTRFRLDMKSTGTDLSDSYIDDNGDVVLTAGIDGTVYTKVIEACDIHEIGPLLKLPIITKQYVETPSVKAAPKAVPVDIEHSMGCMRKNNPEMFAKKKVLKDA